MIKKLLKNLFTTFIFSVILTIAANCIYFAISRQSNDYQHVVPLIIAGAFFLNMILFLMSVPVVFLSSPTIHGNLVVRLLLYFTGTMLFIASIWFSNMQSTDKIFYLITGLIYLAVHTIMYFRTFKNTNI